MQNTSIKQIKFNRGQVSDLLSERVDMGLQNACGTVYDNVYINRYGQLQSSPSLLLCADSTIPGQLLCMFDTGTDKIFMIVLDDDTINVYGPLSKTNPYQKVDYTTVRATHTLSNNTLATVKAYQFGYNVVFYGGNALPWLLNLVPLSNEWGTVTLTVKEDYFKDAFKNVFVRGLNTEVPDDFTVPTNSYYKIANQTGITTSHLVKVLRNNTGGGFTQSLVGQVIKSAANGGALQVRSVEDGDTLWATVLSPMSVLNASDTEIRIPWNVAQSRAPYVAVQYQYESAEWVFGYEQAFGDNAIGGAKSYPDSVIYINQRLVFGGNDYIGNIICASRVGVLNDFDPESATESDAFAAQIASKDFCRIVAFVESNDELNIACTNGEYAIPLANLSPSGALNGFRLRSTVGIALDTPVCDCGGLVSYVSNDRNAIYATQFSLLKDRYQPMSLSSQTQGIVENCKDLVYLTNRPNSEGNCLVGLNGNGSTFVASIDVNSGLVSLSGQKNYINQTLGINPALVISSSRLWRVGSALWVEYYLLFGGFGYNFLTRFTFGEMFDFPTWYDNISDSIRIPWFIKELIFRYPERAQTYRAFYHNPETNKYEFINPTGSHDNQDGTYSLTFADDIVQSNIVCAGFVRQYDWRSVEVGLGMATRETNKRIVKIESVISPTQITGAGAFSGLVLTPEQAKYLITLTQSKDVEKIDIDNLSNTSYTENADLVWRRAFDNPSRELYYGLSAVCPFLMKSITVTISYDEVA